MKPTKEPGLNMKIKSSKTIFKSMEKAPGVPFLKQLLSLHPSMWSLIAGRLPGRTDNEVKNYWNTHLKRKLMQMGIDPKTHRIRHTTGPAISLLSDNQKRNSATEEDNNPVLDSMGGPESYAVSGLPDLNL
ncbi:hypothetical protein Pint_17013 [Pistacia integerrima]|uniref:Uncharacterized protein n=1 Tax=Pistacia integerrima TaxID=434235 RepID=A0ACC0Z9A7_9ROSI|nr:hypothetical protein Pint_17013 [Pistacia integerrima]